MRNTPFLALLLGGAMFVTASSQALAQYTGPGAQPEVLTVSKVLEAPTDDKDVTLKGKLIKKVGNEKYIFADSTGEIRVDIDAEDFPNVAVDEKTELMIVGEIEKDFMESPEIDVDTLSVVK